MKEKREIPISASEGKTEISLHLGLFEALQGW